MSSNIPADSPWRGAAAAYPWPMSQDELFRVQALVTRVYSTNCGPLAHTPLGDIIYRCSENDLDIKRHVYLWNSISYETVFANGFRAWPQDNTENATYYNLEDHVNHGGVPLDTNRPVTHAFISTTLSNGWYPPTGGPIVGETRRMYRYQIYAPGGIWIAQTLGNRYRFHRHDEVAFIGAIAPQYIRSAQLFQVTERGSTQRFERADNVLIINANFNPHPNNRLPLQSPVAYYIDRNDDNKRKKLKKQIHRTLSILAHDGQKRQASDDSRVDWNLEGMEGAENYRQEWQASDDSRVDWYAEGVEGVENYITAAFRARNKDEAYLFMGNEYVLMNYAPGTSDDWIINGPLLICDGYPSLTATAFGEHGIDCAFDTDGTEAFIFCGKLCAYIDYAPRSKNDKILQGPMIIPHMFPFFKDTVFENGIDSAFRATAKNEAYLFKGDRYALINYNSKNLIAIRFIATGFPSLAKTDFKDGIEAAFASHRKDQAYIFKGDKYALINFAPGTAKDYIIFGIKTTVDYWHSLRPILPRQNAGLDCHDHYDEHMHDEL